LAPLSWWPFLVLILLLGLFTRIYPLAAFALMLIVISAIAFWWKRRALDGVIYRRRFDYRRGFPGETLEMRLEVENRKFLPLPWLRTLDSLPGAVGPLDETLLRPSHIPDNGVLLSLFSLRWYERDRRQVNLLLRKRGVYRVGPVRLESGDLFGLFEQVKEDETGTESYPVYLTVFPESIPFQALPLPTTDPYGDRRARRRLYEDPNQPMGVREYHPEDDFRRVHWPATAHTGELQVKVYQPVSMQVMVVCLNVMTMSYYWEGADMEMLEHLVKATAAVVQRGLADGYRVGLVSNGCLSHADQPFRVPPGRSRGQLVQLLTALAGVTPFVSGPFDHFLMSEAPRMPYGATLVILTAGVDNALKQAVQHLKKRNRRITLLTFARQAPDLEGLDPNSGVRVYHVPFRGAASSLPESAVSDNTAGSTGSTLPHLPHQPGRTRRDNGW
jgi:uncharacterized protein (DUF58 family)